MLKRPFILSALVVTALLALAASAAHTNPLSAAGRRSSGAIPTTLVDYAFTTFIIVALVGFIVAVPFIPARGGDGVARRHPARAFRTLGILLITVLLVVFIARHLTPELKNLLHHNSNSGHNGHGAGGKAGNPGPRPVSFQWGELFVLLGLGLGLFLVFRPRRPDPAVGDGVETLNKAISQSLDDLRADPDPRRAIVAAYARMERALAASGVPRHPAEAPHEYLERALIAVDASAGAARRLTELFEGAKFSQHEPDAPMRDEAIAALEAIRDELMAGSEIAA